VFSPRYIVTNKTLRSIIEFEKACLVVSMAPIQNEWELKLKQEALVRRINSVLRFTDNRLDVDDVAKIVKDDPGRDDKPTQVALRSGVVAKEKDLQAAINWLNANKLMEQTAYLSKKFKQGAFETKDLESLNSLLGERIVLSTTLGKYREESCDDLKELAFPPSVEVSYQMEDLFIWFKGAGKLDTHPFIKAGTMLFEILRIRPFVANNVLTGLLFFDLILLSEGLETKGMLAVEEEILKNKQKFVEIVGTTIESGDLTGWFEYLSAAIFASAEKTRTKVLNLVGDGPIFKTEAGKAISLSERQIAIMEEMTIRNEMTIKEIRAVLPMISDDTILRDLKDLMIKKLIRKKGKTKGAVYVLGKVKGFK